jgi:hypothetical protein
MQTRTLDARLKASDLAFHLDPAVRGKKLGVAALGHGDGREKDCQKASPNDEISEPNHAEGAHPLI